MPRTKQPRKRSSTQTLSQENELIRLEDIEKKYKIAVKDIENECNMSMKRISSRIDAALNRMVKEVREMTLGELLKIDYPDKNSDSNSESPMLQDDKSLIRIIPPSTNKPRKLKRQTAASTDDGYVTEGAAQVTQKNAPKHISRIDSKGIKSSAKSKRITRSSSTSVPRKTEYLNLTKRSTSNMQNFKNHSKFVTPAPSEAKTPTRYGVVTPKIKPNTPLNILRRPRDGEMALSMQGSPLYISGVTQDRMANINVPLHNGNIMSLLPRDGLRLSHLPDLDEETMSQLKTLKDHIEKVISQ